MSLDPCVVHQLLPWPLLIQCSSTPTSRRTKHSGCGSHRMEYQQTSSWCHRDVSYPCRVWSTIPIEIEIRLPDWDWQSANHSMPAPTVSLQMSILLCIEFSFVLSSSLPFRRELSAATCRPNQVLCTCRAHHGICHCICQVKNVRY